MRVWGLVALLSSFLWQAAGKTYAAVTLVSFAAEGQPNQVVILWETASELDNAGFYVNRSFQQFSGYERISPFVPGEGDSITGAIYSYIDTEVQNGVGYWYKLEAIDFDQNSSFYEPPVQAIPGEVVNTPTMTVAATITGTASPTTTGTLVSVTPTATATRSATISGPTPTRTLTVVGSTAYPVPATATVIAPQIVPTQASGDAIQPTATSSAIPQPGESITATATLLPLPDLVLQFPEPTLTTATLTPEPQSGQPAGSKVAGWLTPGRIIFILVIVVIWILLGGWFFISMRRIE